MAQQVEHVLGKDEVTGSNPVISSKKRQPLWVVFFWSWAFATKVARLHLHLAGRSLRSATAPIAGRWLRSATAPKRQLLMSCFFFAGRSQLKLLGNTFKTIVARYGITHCSQHRCSATSPNCKQCINNFRFKRKALFASRFFTSNLKSHCKLFLLITNIFFCTRLRCFVVAQQQTKRRVA